MNARLHISIKAEDPLARQRRKENLLGAAALVMGGFGFVAALVGGITTGAW